MFFLVAWVLYPHDWEHKRGAPGPQARFIGVQVILWGRGLGEPQIAPMQIIGLCH